MKSPAPAKPRWTGMWTRDLNYCCPRCGEADRVRLWRGAGERSTWNCPHCQAGLTVLETRKHLLFLIMLPFWIAMAMGLADYRWVIYPLLALSLLLSLRMSRLEVALMPEPKNWA